MPAHVVSALRTFSFHQAIGYFANRFRAKGGGDIEFDNRKQSPSPGIEYVTQIGGYAEQWNESIGGASFDEYDAIRAFKKMIGGSFRKFIYSENDLDGDYWWVRATDGSFKRRNVGGKFAVSFTLDQQLI